MSTAPKVKDKSKSKAAAVAGKTVGKPIDENSLTSRIAALAIGETESRVATVSPGEMVEVAASLFPGEREQLRNNVTTAVTRARARSGNKYSVEVGTMLMPSGWIYHVAIITCMGAA